jgi:hypothetical protein
VWGSRQTTDPRQLDTAVSAHCSTAQGSTTLRVFARLLKRSHPVVARRIQRRCLPGQEQQGARQRLRRLPDLNRSPSIARSMAVGLQRCPIPRGVGWTAEQTGCGVSTCAAARLGPATPRLRRDNSGCGVTSGAPGAALRPVWASGSRGPSNFPGGNPTADFFASHPKPEGPRPIRLRQGFGGTGPPTQGFGVTSRALG